MADMQPFPKHHVLSVMYSGHDTADDSITAHGHVAFGVFEGVIITKEETYYVEPASRYSMGSPDFHSVIYRHSDMNSSSVRLASCGHDSVTEMFQKNLTRAANYFSQSNFVSSSRHEMKRETTPSIKNRCWLNVLGDYDFYTAVASGSTTQERITQAMATLAAIVKQASTIYQSTKFVLSTGQTVQGINFAIKTLRVETSPPTTAPFNNAFIGVQAFLDYWSQADYSKYCLSYRFTYRQFDQGVIGLAYVAAPGSLGGICDTYQSGSGKTLNTGIVTLLNYGQRVPFVVNVVTFAHEAGHNFGSTHDSDTDTVCAPPSGKYIMYAHATDGSQPNNMLFSPCSTKLMGGIIETKSTCFQPGDNNCGNGLVDLGEDCDCLNSNSSGYCISDPCCNATSCKMVSGAQCSPQSGICCDSKTCMFVSANTNLVCSNQTECAYNQSCNGTSSQCPTAKPIDFKKPQHCGSNGAYCLNGACTGTVCNVVLGMENCECTSAKSSCDVCCKIITSGCVSSFSFNSIFNTSFLAAHNITTGQHLQIGLPCANFTGHCDFLYNCQLVNSDGALKLVFSTITSNLGNILVQIKKYWWAALLAGVGVLVAMFLLVLACHFILPRPQQARRKAQQRINQKQQGNKDTEMQHRRR